MPEELTPDELEQQLAADLPDREAMSLIDPSSFLGSTSLPTTPSSGGTTQQSPGTGDPTAATPTLPGNLDSIQKKFIG